MRPNQALQVTNEGDAMLKQFLLLCLLLCLCLGHICDLSAGIDMKSNIVSRAGEYKFFDAQITLKVTIDDDNVSIRMKSALRPRSEDRFKFAVMEGPFWLVYVEAVNKVWLFRGRTLTELDLSDEGITSTPVSGRGVLEKVPKALLGALPINVRKNLESR